MDTDADQSSRLDQVLSSVITPIWETSKPAGLPEVFGAWAGTLEVIRASFEALLFLQDPFQARQAPAL